ncbi:MAG TPA: flavin reductase family protein [Ktedonobacterales bacterium]|jgi:flavin reductase (DIM6/NTAB) family NADH-FMN oxidoreductase RutF
MSDSAESFRAWAGRWASSVAVVIAGEGDDMRAATITAFVPVSFDPPLVAIFLNRTSRMSDLLRHSERWTVSLLETEQYRLARHFAHAARLTGSAELEQIGVVDLGEGPPALASAAAWLSCVRENILEVGDHSMLVGSVMRHERQLEARPLLAWRGTLHRLGEVASPAHWNALAADDLSADF